MSHVEYFHLTVVQLIHTWIWIFHLMYVFPFKTKQCLPVTPYDQLNMSYSGFQQWTQQHAASSSCWGGTNIQITKSELTPRTFSAPSHHPVEIFPQLFVVGVFVTARWFAFGSGGWNSVKLRLYYANFPPNEFLNRVQTQKCVFAVKWGSLNHWKHYRLLTSPNTHTQLPGCSAFDWVHCQLDDF